MCGRATLTQNEQDLESQFNATFYTEDILRYNPIPSFNIAPSHVIPILTMEDKNHFLPAIWGWNQPIGSEKNMYLINAKAETLSSKKSFEPLLHSGRCVIPLSGYYEWIKNGKQKIPHYIHIDQKDVFPVAGIYSEIISNGQMIKHVVIITTSAIPSINHIHERMPLILTEEEKNHWLSDQYSTILETTSLKTKRHNNIKYHKVSSKVNYFSNNDPSLLTADLSENYIQTRLF